MFITFLFMLSYLSGMGRSGACLNRLKNLFFCFVPSWAVVWRAFFIFLFFCLLVCFLLAQGSTSLPVSLSLFFFFLYSRNAGKTKAVLSNNSLACERCEEILSVARFIYCWEPVTTTWGFLPSGTLTQDHRGCWWLTIGYCPLVVKCWCFRRDHILQVIFPAACVWPPLFHSPVKASIPHCYMCISFYHTFFFYSTF